MKVAAIIAEYNPFHKGHKYQIDAIRETLGQDTAIVAIMSVLIIIWFPVNASVT